MQEIVKLAAELGERISQSPAYTALRAAEVQIERDDEAVELTNRFRELSEKMRDKEKNLQPIEPEEKHALMDVQAKCAQNAALQNLMRAQVEYSNLIRSVNDEIYRRLTPADDRTDQDRG